LKVNETDGKPIYEIRHAAVLESVLAPFEEFEDSYFNVTTGDFGPLLNLVNEELAKAKKYVANEKETGMLDLYIDSFERGSLDAHKVLI
jgi:dipeptidyl-peptidase-3